MPDTISREKPKTRETDASQNQGASSRDLKTAMDAVGDSQSAPLTIHQATVAPRIIIHSVSPSVENGKRPAKATVGQEVRVHSTIFCDGHNRLAARVLWKEEGATSWFGGRMSLLGNDLWHAEFTPSNATKHHFRVEAWLDRWQNFHHELHAKFYAGVPIELELKEGALLLQEIFAHRVKQREAAKTENDGDSGNIRIINRDQMPLEEATLLVEMTLTKLGQDLTSEQRVHVLLDQQLARAVEVLEPRQFLARSQDFALDVERTKAGFASWYELFPRSTAAAPGEHGTFDDVVGRLPDIQAMGFDVLYFPPIHPIGLRNRKGKNNSVNAVEGEVGSPYAIGSAEGGHDTVYSKLGGIEAFRRLRQAAEQHGLELAMDFAIQCAPDHPWLEQHPDWFTWRPDGSIRYAENPPKKYQDIVNVDFYQAGAKPDMWLEWRDIILYWISEGVKIFRVDNPHTKPLPFWEWLIADVRSKHPDAIFLSEAFTRPAMMHELAKIGFTQSYTYFIWRNSKQEITEYMTELSHSPVSDFYRPNFFVNTPDINPHFLQTSGRPGFLIRTALATTLSGLWGMYSGFELCEAAPLPGKEEYLDSEKYELRQRDYNAPGNIKSEITRLNAIRKENPALQTHLGIRFYHASNDQVLFFGKGTPGGDNFILVAISLDPHHAQEAILHLPTEEFGLGDYAEFAVHELMRDIHFNWYGREQHWYFDPGEIPFAVWSIQPQKA